MKTDIDKALKEGKSIILEGFHIDPALYLHLIEHNSIISSSDKFKDEPKGVIIPFIFNMNEKDHRLFVENWLSCSIHDRQFAKVNLKTKTKQTSLSLSLSLCL